MIADTSTNLPVLRACWHSVKSIRVLSLRPAMYVYGVVSAERDVANIVYKSAKNGLKFICYIPVLLS